MGGSKTTTNKTEIPLASHEELENVALLNGLIESQLIQQGFETRTTMTMVDYPDGSKRPRYETEVSENPAAQRRRLRRESQSDQVEANMFKAVNKLTRGDYSVTDKQKQQIESIINTAGFDNIIDEITVNFGRAEEAILKASDRLVASGKADIVEAAKQNRLQLKETAALLGRSTQDSDISRSGQEFELGALERLGRSAEANTTGLIANLKGTEAGMKSGVREQETLARLNLLNQAAQPVLALQAGGQFAQLQGALQAQNFANQLGTSRILQGEIGRQTQERIAQPTTTQTQQVGVLDVLGALVGTAAAGAGAAFGGIGAFRK